MEKKKRRKRGEKAKESTNASRNKSKKKFRCNRNGGKKEMASILRNIHKRKKKLPHKKHITFSIFEQRYTTRFHLQKLLIVKINREKKGKHNNKNHEN